ncbi:MAG: hypothetical protein B6D46_15745 [Polyangiaceae bacterium UTPRO1]|nr:hypothetical protein [Myxococcales bacterium]OQY64909.1 MAG: hypothetical protein B6D46_15745 [Polyangiaceae bacterium UTPRO1]
MTVSFELSADERRLLSTHLRRHIEHLDAELVRTDQPALQHALAREIDQLRAIAQRLDASSGR